MISGGDSIFFNQGEVLGMCYVLLLYYTKHCLQSKPLGILLCLCTVEWFILNSSNKN